LRRPLVTEVFGELPLVFLKRDLWLQAVPSGRGCLCLNVSEARIAAPPFLVRNGFHRSWLRRRGELDDGAAGLYHSGLARSQSRQRASAATTA
jgi:hypothetical protein